MRYGARNSVNYRRFYINKQQRGRKTLVYNVLMVKCVKLFVFVRKKLAFVELAKRRFMNCLHNFLPKSLAAIDSFSSISRSDLFYISKLLTFHSKIENKQTTCSKIANANFVGLRLCFQCFCLLLII